VVWSIGCNQCPNWSLGFSQMGVCTLQWPYMDVIMVVFYVFPKYKKINKIKFIEKIKKGPTYLKLS
jgi:hypothetical protein